MFKKSVVLALAFTFLGTTIASAQNTQAHSYNSNHKNYKKMSQHNHAHWKQGQHYAGWKRHKNIENYKQHGLHKPKKGNHWIKVNDQYLQIHPKSGSIVETTAPR